MTPTAQCQRLSSLSPCRSKGEVSMSMWMPKSHRHFRTKLARSKKPSSGSAPAALQVTAVAGQPAVTGALAPAVDRAEHEGFGQPLLPGQLVPLHQVHRGVDEVVRADKSLAIATGGGLDRQLAQGEVVIRVEA